MFCILSCRWQETSIAVACSMDFSLFPFDSHVCPVTFDVLFHRIERVLVVRGKWK